MPAARGAPAGGAVTRQRLVRHPHRLKLAQPQQPGQRAGAEPVGLRPRLHDPSVIRTDHDHPVHVRLQDPRDLPRAAGHLQRHPIRALKTLRQRTQSRGRARHPTGRMNHPSSQIAITQKSVNIQADRATHPPCQRHPHLHSVDTQRENQRDNDTDRYELEAQSRQVAGAAERKARARSPPIKTAYPSAFSQEGPVPDQPALRPLPDGASGEQFHASEGVIDLAQVPTAPTVRPAVGIRPSMRPLAGPTTRRGDGSRPCCSRMSRKTGST